MKTLALSLVIAILLSVSGTTLMAGVEQSYFAVFPFDEGAGTSAKDISKNKFVGTLSKGATWTKNGKFRNAIEFNGTDGYVEVVADVPEENFTMALWLKTDVATQGVCAVLDGAAGAGGHDRHFFITGGNISFRVWKGGGWNTTTKVSDGQWHYIALVVKKGDGQRAYVDGKEIGKNAYDQSDFNWQKRVWVGFSNDAAPNYFKGIIDEFAYYNASLTENEVKSTMATGLVAVEPKGKLTTVWSRIKTDY